MTIANSPAICARKRGKHVCTTDKHWKLDSIFLIPSLFPCFSTTDSLSEVGRIRHACVWLRQNRVQCSRRPQGTPHLFTHIETLRKREQPRRLLVMGAGTTALEFSQMFRHFGSEVMMVARGDRLYKRTEPEVSEALEQYLRDEGIAVHKEATIQRPRMENHRKIATITPSAPEEEIVFDELLIGTGKTANTEALGLDAAGVTLSDKRFS